MGPKWKLFCTFIRNQMPGGDCNFLLYYVPAADTKYTEGGESVWLNAVFLYNEIAVQNVKKNSKISPPLQVVIFRYSLLCVYRKN
jgi:hypothetical protein